MSESLKNERVVGKEVERRPRLIITNERGRFFRVEVEGHPEISEISDDVYYAVGAVIKKNPSIFGIEIENRRNG